MRIKAAIIGGGRRGVEAAYLAAQAGWETWIIDKDARASAADMGSRFFCMDALDIRQLFDVIRRVSVVIPAISDPNVLECARIAAAESALPYLHDPAAFAVTSSRMETQQMLKRLRVPAAVSWPGCGFPVLARLDRETQPSMTTQLSDDNELEEFLKVNGALGKVSLSQYFPGPTYCIEVVGNGRDFAPLQITEMCVDDIFECATVTAPANLNEDYKAKLTRYALKIATCLNLHGILSVRACRHERDFKVTDVRAEIPSQTPLAVYHSTGINLLEVLWNWCGNGQNSMIWINENRSVLCADIQFASGRVQIRAQKDLGSVPQLRVVNSFFGADHAITNFVSGINEWVASMIFHGHSASTLKQRHNQAMTLIEKYGESLL